MAKVCHSCGKRPAFGNSRSHSLVATRRRFNPNLQKVRIQNEGGGTQRVQLDTGVPCAFGVITAENMDQALARSGGDKRDQGRGAAIVAMRMSLLAEALRVAKP